MRSSRELALSRAIQTWLLNNEPTPAAKSLAQNLSLIDNYEGESRDIVRIVLRHPKISVEALQLYHHIAMLSDAVDMALDDLADEGIQHHG